MSSERPFSIVIPVYRSAASLEHTVSAYVDFFASREAFEIILINDGSPDRVDLVIERLVQRDERIRAITLGNNIGQHRALLRGFRITRGEVVVTVDDDGQNPPEAALAVLEEYRRVGADVVYGSFETVEQSLPRRTASALNRWLSRRTMGNRTDLSISNVRAIRGDLARALGAIDMPYPYIDALIFRMTRHITAVPVVHRPRSNGASTYSASALLRLWVSHLTSLTVLPLQFAMLCSFGVSALGFATGAFQLVRSLRLGGAPLGWLSLFVSVTFLFSLLFAFLGIISAYIGRMYVSLSERDLVWVRTSHDSTPSVGS